MNDKSKPMRVAVVGSGPSGFYAAEALLKDEAHAVEVDMFERLPTPYGLVRGGVAPDHQSIKAVTRIYEKRASDPRYRFFGNIAVGRDISVDVLRRHYHQIVFAVGHEHSRRMGVPGEGLYGVHPAALFVGWYNGHPDFREAQFDFSKKRVAVVGNGNVAIDVARILAKNVEELRATDIAGYALDALRESQIEEIFIIGRRGPVQAAFTPKEASELLRLEAAQPLVSPEDLQLDAASEAALAKLGEKSREGKNMAHLRSFRGNNGESKPRRIHFSFLRSPVEILGDMTGHVSGLKLEKNRLEAGAGDYINAIPTGETESLKVGTIFSAIGFRGSPIEGLPFDEKRGLIPNRDGRIYDPQADAVIEGAYVVGWARSGPQGLIGIHKAASAEVVNAMFEDFQGPTPIADRDAIVRLLADRGLRVISFDDWKILDAHEVERGKDRGAPRDKLSQVDDMLATIESGRNADRESGPDDRGDVS